MESSFVKLQSKTIIDQIRPTLVCSTLLSSGTINTFTNVSISTPGGPTSCFASCIVTSSSIPSIVVLDLEWFVYFSTNHPNQDCYEHSHLSYCNPTQRYPVIAWIGSRSLKITDDCDATDSLDVDGITDRSRSAELALLNAVAPTIAVIPPVPTASESYASLPSEYRSRNDSDTVFCSTVSPPKGFCCAVP